LYSVAFAFASSHLVHCLCSLVAMESEHGQFSIDSIG
jgi:hypothetical protein